MKRLFIPLLLTLCGLVQAGTILGHQPTCEKLAGLAYKGAALRDQGMPWAEFESYIIGEIQTELSNPKATLVKDADDGLLIHHMFWVVWEHPELPPGEISKIVYVQCLAEAPAKTTWRTT